MVAASVKVPTGVVIPAGGKEPAELTGAARPGHKPIKPIIC